MARIEPFEKHPLRYEQWFDKHKFAYESELQAIRKLLPQGGNGLEIGVGSGRFAVPLGIKLGIEPSSKMMQIALRRGIEVIGGVAESLPFRNLQFDFALMVTTICFLDNVEVAFNEAYRILKPDGCLIIGFIDKDSPVGQLYQQHKYESVFYKIATFYSVDEVVSCLKKAKFNGFDFSQTIFHNLAEMEGIELVREGYGEGSFVVVRAVKMTTQV
ncbi:MAG: SAM-dependent methyltransferase [Dehalococcoidia bacterium CG2_30_46_19]|nr:MAG: SAM-dependent methyltransferase [Dehalococcoidia bacterium CG2_30_46_19]